MSKEVLNHTLWRIENELINLESNIYSTDETENKKEVALWIREIMQKYYLMVYNKILEDKSDKSFLDCIDETLLTDMSPITLAKTWLDNGYNGDIANKINYLINDTFKINLVTCWNCGKIMSHEVWVEWDLTCGDCGRNGEQSDFPDLFY